MIWELTGKTWTKISKWKCSNRQGDFQKRKKIKLLDIYTLWAPAETKARIRVERTTAFIKSHAGLKSSTLYALLPIQFSTYEQFQPCPWSHLLYDQMKLLTATCSLPPRMEELHTVIPYTKWFLYNKLFRRLNMSTCIFQGTEASWYKMTCA